MPSLPPDDAAPQDLRALVAVLREANALYWVRGFTCTLEASRGFW